MKHNDSLMPEWARTPIKMEGGIMSPYEYEGNIRKKKFEEWEIKYKEEQRRLRGEVQ